MKVEYRRHMIALVPENDADEVYLETVLRLKKAGDTAVVERVAATGMPSVWAFANLRPGAEDTNE